MYECDNFMYHYYICFFDQLIGGQSLFDNTEIHYQLPATEMDRMLMLRFLELNSDCAIQDPDPKTYDNIPDIYTVNQNKVNYSLNKEIRPVPPASQSAGSHHRAFWFVSFVCSFYCLPPASSLWLISCMQPFSFCGPLFFFLLHPAGS